MSDSYGEQSGADDAIKAGGSYDLYTVSAAETLPKYVRHVRVVCTGSTYILTLPPLSTCKGAHIAFTVVTAGAGEVTVKSAGDGVGETGTPTDLAGDNLNNVGDHLLFYNAGLKWIVVSDNTNA